MEAVCLHGASCLDLHLRLLMKSEKTEGTISVAVVVETLQVLMIVISVKNDLCGGLKLAKTSQRLC